MFGSRIAFALSAVSCLAVLAVAWTLSRPDPSRRNFEVFTEMAYSRAYESFSPNSNFADGKTIQPLVAGVVPRKAAPFPYGDGPEEAARAGDELLDPLPPPDRASAAAGAELYRIYCVVCHDARGGGRGPVTSRGMLPPPSLHAARATTIKDGEMFHVLTRGQGNMSSYAAELSVAERWQVIRHVRRLQEEGP